MGHSVTPILLFGIGISPDNIESIKSVLTEYLIKSKLSRSEEEEEEKEKEKEVKAQQEKNTDVQNESDDYDDMEFPELLQQFVDIIKQKFQVNLTVEKGNMYFDSNNYGYFVTLDRINNRPAYNYWEKNYNFNFSIYTHNSANLTDPEQEAFTYVSKILNIEYGFISCCIFD